MDGPSASVSIVSHLDAGSAFTGSAGAVVRDDTPPETVVRVGRPFGSYWRFSPAVSATP